jgi:hypothetical protein
VTAAFDASIVVRSGEGTKLLARLYVDVSESFASLNYLIDDSSKTVVYEILSNELIAPVGNAEIWGDEQQCLFRQINLKALLSLKEFIELTDVGFKDL